MPSVTVVIAARPDQAEIQAISAARALDYPADKLEIILARGKQPSAQRNAAIKAARGDLIYFLDDDSVPEPKNLRRVMGHFADSDVKLVGGPNICPADAPPLEQTFALVLGSRAWGPSRARYTPVGTVRQTSEKELILCNLIARRDALLELGGFNEKLYPNEENALMDELQARGGKLLYDSQLIVRRRPRRTLKGFAKMLMTYGRGRAEQFRETPTLGSALNFVPPLFLLYLLLLIPLLKWKGSIFAWPLIFYFAGLLLQAAVLSRTGKIRQSFLAIPLMFLTHILYGFGFWRGLFTTLKPKAPAAAQVTLEKLSLGREEQK
jgi:cellulose synthase/poly-beta-1,6-N-acetylglucosamine synthase-like glycosyltransferase